MATEREIITFPRNDVYTRSRLQKCGVRKLKTKKERKKVLMIGTGRCGTTFSTHALRTAGLKVKHELTGPDGTVSHFFLVDSDWHPRRVENNKLHPTLNHMGERKSDFEFEHTFHVVRNPLKTIPSMVSRFNGLVFLYYEENGVIPAGIKNTTLRSMHLWYEYNKRAQDQADMTFQVEKYALAWPQMMDRMGLDTEYPAHLKPMNKSSGFHVRPAATYEDLNALDPTLARNIRKLAKSYGYKE